jgi:hypothetical protein
LLDKEYEKVREIKYKPKFNVNVGDILWWTKGKSLNKTLPSH